MDACSYSALLRRYRGVVQATPHHIHSMCFGDDAICDNLTIGAVRPDCLNADGIAWPIDGSDASEDDVKDKLDLVESFDNGDLLDSRLPDHAMSRLVDAGYRCCRVHVFKEGDTSDGVKDSRVLAVMLVCGSLDARQGAHCCERVGCGHMRQGSMPICALCNSHLANGPRATPCTVPSGPILSLLRPRIDGAYTLSGKCDLRVGRPLARGCPVRDNCSLRSDMGLGPVRRSKCCPVFSPSAS